MFIAYWCHSCISAGTGVPCLLTCLYDDVCFLSFSLCVLVIPFRVAAVVAYEFSDEHVISCVFAHEANVCCFVVEIADDYCEGVLFCYCWVVDACQWCFEALVDGSGSVSCAGFGDSTCSDNQAYGCLVLDCDTAIAKSELFSTPTWTCEEAGSTCAWTCGAETNQEICSNNVDDDGINGIDCADSACNAGGSLSITDAELARYNCLGTSQTGDVDGLAYQCSSPDSRDDFGLCCPQGFRPEWDLLNSVWYCTDTAPCRGTLDPNECSSDYGVDPLFTAWRQDTNCLDSLTPSACCNVVKFGDLDYWSDSGNVVIYQFK